MQRSILEELYFGNISPCENQKIFSPEMKKYQKNISDLEGQLLQSLTGRDREIFENFSNSYLIFNEMTASSSFLQGFRIGGLMIIDLFGGQDSVIGTK